MRVQAARRHLCLTVRFAVARAVILRPARRCNFSSLSNDMALGIVDSTEGRYDESGTDGHSREPRIE